MNQESRERAKVFLEESAKNRLLLLRQLKEHKPSLFSRFKQTQVESLLKQYAELIREEDRIYKQIIDYVEILKKEQAPEWHAFYHALKATQLIIEEERHILEDAAPSRTKLRKLLTHALREEQREKHIQAVLNKIEAQMQVALAKVQRTMVTRKMRRQLTTLLNLAIIATVFSDQTSGLSLQVKHLKEILTL